MRRRIRGRNSPFQKRAFISPDVLMVTSRERSPSLPQVLSPREAGAPQYEATGWFTIATSAKSQMDAVRRRNADIEMILKAPEMASRWSEPGGTPEAAENFFAAERGRWTKVIKIAGTRGD
jgi:tripartite-type tricarboxylate transporter receptor subunit TctC